MSDLLRPKLFSILESGYSRETFLRDLVAGSIVAIVALPLAIAFAIASGVNPEQGLYTAIIAGIIVSAFGGSRVQIAGPTGAFIVIVHQIVQMYGYNGLAIATLMAGAILVIMGIARLGSLLRFVPYPLTVGFTSGIALIIFSSQLKDFLGLPMESVPADVVEKWIAYGRNFSSLDPNALVVASVSLVIILLWPKITHRVPGSLVAILTVTAGVHLIGIPVETIGSRFGSVPNTLPSPRIPDVSWSSITTLISPAMTIAMLGAIESLLSASVADGMIRSRHRSSMELVAQGVANIISPIFSGIPATGAIARTATNVKNGGKTPISGIIHSVVLLLIMVFFGQWASLIPMPTLAAILIVVAYDMSEWHSFVRTFRSPKSDVAVMVVTFLLTVIVDLTVAIQTGVILSGILFIRRMAQVSQVNVLTRDLQEETSEDEGDTTAIPEGVEVFEVYGSLFFGAVEQFNESIRSLRRKPKVFILETRNLLAIDATGLRAVEDLATDLKNQSIDFIVSGLHKQPLFALQQAGVLDQIGENNLCGTLAESFDKARTIVKERK